jgi:hypothetical protein
MIMANRQRFGETILRQDRHRLAGNAIDFHVQVLGRSFYDALRQITGSVAP